MLEEVANSGGNDKMSQLPEAAADVRSTAAFWSYYTMPTKFEKISLSGAGIYSH